METGEGKRGGEGFRDRRTDRGRGRERIEDREGCMTENMAE